MESEINEKEIENSDRAKRINKDNRTCSFRLIDV